MPEELPVIRAAFDRTVRLVSSARLREAVLRPLVDSAEDLEILAAIEGATSARLLAESRGVEALDPKELVHDVPHAAFINASFAYARPRQPNRFNGPKRGAWYAALAVETALAEVSFHMAGFLANTGSYNAVVEYAELFASFAGAFVDLRDVELKPRCLDPNQSIGYPAGNELADRTRAEGLNGIIYPSVRHAGGTCLVALRPQAVQSVAQGGLYRLTWSGEAAPIVESIQSGE